MGNGPHKNGQNRTASNNTTESPSIGEMSVHESLQHHQKTQSEYQYLAKITHFDENTLRLLHARFMEIDVSIHEDGVISMDEFARVLGVDSKSLLVQRFFNFIDKSEMGTVNFRNFAVAMSILSNEASAQEKMELSFSLYDMNNDKLIDRGELRKMVCAASEYIDMHLSTEQIDKLVSDTFMICDSDKNGFIDFDEYCAFCRKNPRILQPFTIDVRNLIEYELESRRQQRTPEHIKELNHGATQSTSGNGRIHKIKHSIGRKLQKFTKNDVVNVESIYEPKDVLKDLDGNESSDEEEEPSYLAGGGKISDYAVDPDIGSATEKPSSTNTNTHRAGDHSHTHGWHSDSESYQLETRKQANKSKQAKPQHGTTSQPNESIHQ